MKLKKFITAALAFGMFTGISPAVSHAEYITALEDIHYEKYVVDTDSVFFPDKEHKLNAFNVIIWSYTSETDKGIAYTLRYKFEKGEWKMAEKVKTEDGKEKLEWDKLEENSVASNVLRIMIPYITSSGKTMKK
jgi:hypothetical protein